MWRFLNDLAFRARAIFRRDAADRDLRDEFTHHRAMLVAELRAAGSSADDAEYQANAHMGSDAAELELARDGWGVSAVNEFLADVRYALRQMRRHPGFAAIAVLTVGVGIGATVALASVAYTVILRALPYADESRIHVFWSSFDWGGDEYEFVRERKGIFSGLAAFATNDDPYVVDPQSKMGAQQLRYVFATSTLFDVLGVRPALGPGITAEDDRPNAPPVVVISHAMWQSDLGGDPGVIGRQIHISGTPVAIVGVMPKGFYFPTPEYQAWRPVQIDPASSMYSVGYLTLVGRTPAGTSQNLINGDVQRIARDLGQRFEYTTTNDKTRNAHVTPVHTHLLGDVRNPILLLLSAVLLLLVIASANTAALVLARTSDRDQEMSVRTAMGAGRWRLVRQVIAESIVLSLTAAGLGAVIATAGFPILVSQLPLGNGVGETLTAGTAVPAVAFALALVIGGAISIAPARGILKRRVDPALSRERSESGLRRGARRFHAAIIAGQVTFAVMLAVGAALLARSVDRIRALDPGFVSKGITTFTLATRDDVSIEITTQLLRDVITRTSALPGVTASGMINRLPVRDWGFQSVVSVEGRPDLEDANRPNVLYRIVSTGFFDAMGMRIAQGRGIDATDRANSLPVTVVSESFARAMWPGQNPIGKHVITGWTGTKVAREVVGVARETRMTSMTGPNPYVMFVPFEQANGRTGSVLVVRTAEPAAALIPAVRRVVADLDPLVAVTRAGSMDAVVATALAQPLRLRFFLGVFATLAVLLSAAGVFGTVRYAVARRRAEFGIRIALGAAPSRVVSGVVRQALSPVVIGACCGIVGTLMLSHLMRGFLYEVAPSDLTSMMVATGWLLSAAIIAALAPALQASRTSPAESLRAE